MDINDWRGISTTLLLIVFVGTWIWLWGSKRKKGFDEAANLPFADEETHKQSSSVANARSPDGE